MKKLLLSAAAVAAFSTVSFAEGSDFYLRADAGINKFNDQKYKIDSSSIKAKSKVSPSMEVGVGYNVMDNLRAEIAYGHHFNVTRKGSSTVESAGKDVKIADKAKTQIQTVMVKGFYDVADLGVAQVFVGAGVGLARVSEKTNPSTDGKSMVSSLKEKNKNNFTWALALGSSFDITDAVKFDVQYNFQSFGKTSGKTTSKIEEFKKVTKAAYRSHAIKAGVRFAI